MIRYERAGTGVAMLFVLCSTISFGQDFAPKQAGSSLPIHELFEKVSFPREDVPIELSASYTAVALEDFSDYHRAKTKLVRRFYNKKGNPELSERGIKPNDILATATTTFAGDVSKYFYSVKFDRPLLHFKGAEAVFDGSLFVVRTDPGSHLSVEQTFNPPLAAFNAIPTRLSPRVSDQPRMGHASEGQSLNDLVRGLAKSPTTAVRQQNNLHVVEGYINERRDSNAGLLRDKVRVEIGTAATPVLNKVEITPVRIVDGKETFAYGSSLFEFEGAHNLGDFHIPRKVVMTRYCRLSEFGGQTNADIATVLAVSKEDVANKLYAVIRHTYVCDKAKLLPEGWRSLGYMKVRQNERLFNRFTDEFRAVSENTTISDIASLMSKSTPLN